ncbi:MAG: HlyD family efflux transporter periplasmic adaptor subunit [Lewinella sp.]|nr:HlyD family efflux transporter periplasmic adaptor subunit [Lewinella sp.]
MKKLHSPVLFVLLIAGLLTSCGDSQTGYDATGIFEADAVIVSAQGAGQLLSFLPEEGARLDRGQVVGEIDCTTISLQREQVTASMDAIEAKRFEAGPQVAVLREQRQVQENQLAALREQLRVMAREHERLQNLVTAEAAPSKQLDDIDGQIAILERQIAAAESQLEVTSQQITSQQQTVALQNRGLLSEKEPLSRQVDLLDEQLSRCTITNPLPGTVLLTYTEAFEMTAPGKPLYKIAPLDTLLLRAYVTGEQLNDLRLGQAVTVNVDDSENGRRPYPGTLQWLADEAEFTPKTIQTKEERANLVYAIKIAVPNSDGKLKIGMYGEVVFNQDQE